MDKVRVESGLVFFLSTSIIVPFNQSTIYLVSPLHKPLQVGILFPHRETLPIKLPFHILLYHPSLAPLRSLDGLLRLRSQGLADRTLPFSIPLPPLHYLFRPVY
jgi:hypothetical protein